MSTQDTPRVARDKPAPKDPPPPGVPTLADVRQHLVSPAEPAVARVVETRLCTAGGAKAAGFVRHVALDVSATPLAGSFRAGQSFGVVPPGTDERGRPHKLRLYSIASPTRGEDGQGNVLATTVKRTIDEHWDDHRLFLGVASNHLCDLPEGGEVLVTGPAGKTFVLPADPGDHDYLFFATGTGIAPFRAFLGDLLAPGSGFSGSVTLVMGSPWRTDLLYHADLLALANEHANFRYLTALSRERQDDLDQSLYVQDRLETHRDELLALLASERTLVYICGIAGMELGIFRRLTELCPPDVRDHYLRLDPDIAGNPASWERRMIRRQLRPTKRVMLEVY